MDERGGHKGADRRMPYPGPTTDEDNGRKMHFPCSRTQGRKSGLLKEVLMRTLLFTCLFLCLVNCLHAKVIDFEDLTRHLPGTDLLFEDVQAVAKGYMGFDWSRDRTGDPLSGSPWCATGEAFLWMEGTGGTYAYTPELCIAAGNRPFHLMGLDVGSFFFQNQAVFVSGLASDGSRWRESFIISDVMSLARFDVGFRNLRSFALWTGSGVPAAGFMEDFPHMLSIDNIEYDWSEPVPEPSTLLILGSGMAGLASLIRKYRR
jgi:hypothetical protein